LVRDTRYVARFGVWAYISSVLRMLDTKFSAA
jgi:hypothetical protein